MASRCRRLFEDTKTPFAEATVGTLCEEIVELQLYLTVSQHVIAPLVHYISGGAVWKCEGAFHITR